MVMKLPVALLLTVWLIARSVTVSWAQQPAIKPAPTPAATDSTSRLRSPTDSIPMPDAPAIRVGSSVLASATDSTTGRDTVQLTARQEAKIHKIIPRQATIRSLILPGLGQAYNRQYYKIPFIYAGFGVMGYLFVKYRGLAKEAENGYRLLLYGQKTESGAVVKVESVVIGNQIVRTTTGAKAGYDIYRRYRDLNILLSVLLWGVNAIEANVAAHLKTFDLSDDISLRVEPSVMPMPGPGLVPGVRLAFTFK